MYGRERLLLAILMAVLAGVVAAGCDRGSQANYPTKPIEFVVHSATGGGSDIFARSTADIITKNKLVPVSISVVNKPGGSSGVAKAYVNEKSGDPYYWMTATTSFQTSSVRNQTPLSYKDFTPLAMFAEDTFVLLVKDDSPVKSIKELIDRAVKEPGKVNWAGSSVGNDDHVLMYLMQEATGAKFNYVSFESGGEVMASLLGGHVDMASANPQEAAGQIEAKKVRVLVGGGEKRVPSLPDVPTLKELGVNAAHTQWRGIVGPPKMPADSVKYLDDMWTKLKDTADWKKFLKDNDLTEKFATSADFGKFLETDYARYDKIMDGLGIKKK